MSAARLYSVPTGDVEPKRAVIYARTSRDQKRRGKSTASQVEFCQREAQHRGWDVVDVIIDDGRSASEYARGGREGWDAVVAMVESGAADILLMWEGSRATRALETYVALEKTLRRTGVILSYDGETYDLSRPSDRRRARQDAVEAGYEADRTQARIMRQKQSDAEAGWPGGMVPYGYQRVYDRATGALVGQEPEPHSSAVVRWVADLILVEGWSPHAVAMELDRRDEMTPHEWREVRRGNPRPKTGGWTSKTVSQVLRGPAIAGLRQHKTADGKEAMYAAAWPAIISSDERQALLRATYRPSMRTHQGNAPKHLLTWLAACGECGRPVRHATKQGRGTIRYHAYACGNRRCGAVYISQAPVDELVSRTVISFLSSPASRALVEGGKPSPARLALADAVRREKELGEKKSELRTAFLAGAMSAETLGEVTREIERELAEIEAARMPAPVTGSAVLRLSRADDVEVVWDGMLVADRRAVIRELFEVVLRKSESKGKRFDPSRVDVRRRA